MRCVVARCVCAWAAVAAVAAVEKESRPPRYGFYREPSGSGRRAGVESRRVFGGAAARPEEFPAACALLDEHWRSVCSCSVVGARWALTAAHCVSRRVRRVAHGVRRLPRDRRLAQCHAAPVHSRYRHPGYKVVHEDEGYGPDVTLLHHDVGLVRTRRDMRPSPSSPPSLSLSPLAALELSPYDPARLFGEEIQVVGFGGYGAGAEAARDEQLRAAALRLAACGRASWRHCACAVGAAAVCAGDSGGPALLAGVQIGVTSMGPVECSGGSGGAAASVVTLLRPYAARLRAALAAADGRARSPDDDGAGTPDDGGAGDLTGGAMRLVGGAAAAGPGPLAAAALAVVWASRVD